MRRSLVYYRSLIVALDGQERRIQLEQIDDISVGCDAQEQLSVRVDDHCVSLLLEDGRGLTLHFEDTEQCNTFAECLSKVMVQYQSKEKSFGKIDSLQHIRRMLVKGHGPIEEFNENPVHSV